MSKPKILFMGTPNFAVPSLEKLLINEYQVIGVITQPDKPKGRGCKLAPSPVKVLAEEKKLVVYQPKRVRDEEFLSIFRQIRPDVVIVAAFGQILPREILEAPPLGCINVHPSLLPRYRGAAPLNWTLIRCEEKTGVTIMFMDEGVDTGDIILQEETDIEEDETVDHLHDRLVELGAALLVAALRRIEAGTALRYPQDNALATYAPRLKKETGFIDWQGKAREIVCLIRGLSSVPGAYTILEGKMLRIFKAAAEEAAVTQSPGTVGAPSPRGLPIVASDGYVYIQDIQLEGKKRMAVQDFLRGYRLHTGARLG
ncbi:MAG: methionyl-tRNA formyltransferase [Syntrophales bacterium]|nr:methionyl-tRNA formyltransferase [Syntrophales bacterium]